jgi:hypothetical protein
MLHACFPLLVPAVPQIACLAIWLNLTVAEIQPTANKLPNERHRLNTHFLPSSNKPHTFEGSEYRLSEN